VTVEPVPVELRLDGRSTLSPRFEPPREPRYLADPQTNVNRVTKL
jgi:hypothetical protein